jgi:hypothetical protein
MRFLNLGFTATKQIENPGYRKIVEISGSRIGTIRKGRMMPQANL